MNRDKLIKRYRVADPEKFRLGDFSPDDRGGLGLDKRAAQELLAKDIKRLSDLQERLYAQDRWAVLVIFQAMDAAGKDSTIRAVLSGVNPAGCDVHSFRQPTAEEAGHDFLWRCVRRLPQRGGIGVFNRSYYEEVLIARVHPELLAAQGLQAGPALWKHRYRSIRDHEKHLARNGTVVLKFWLNVSRAEQKRRFLDRLREPEKNWKFEAADVAERKHWRAYQSAYQEALRETARSWAPWYAIPADDKAYMRLAVADIVVRTLESLDLRYPRAGAAARREFKAIARRLRAERG
jgi:PPK2 family polyphosphate:nucleotide phosphotransferase